MPRFTVRRNRLFVKPTFRFFPGHRPRRNSKYRRTVVGTVVGGWGSDSGGGWGGGTVVGGKGGTVVGGGWGSDSGGKGG